MAPRAVWEFPFKGELGISLLVQCLKTPSSQCGGGGGGGVGRGAGSIPWSGN